MKRFLSILLSLATLVSVAACSAPASSSVAPASAAASASAEAPAATELDVLKIGVAALPDTMDPIIKVGNTGIRVQYNVFETLILCDQQDNSAKKPMLAESWKRIDDNTLEFTLRKGVRFHNGDELKASDVVFSMNRLKEGIANSELAASLMSTVKEAKAIDDYTVQIITDVVDPILEDRLASSWGSWIMPESYVKQVGNDGFAAKPVGTGPFKVVSFSPQSIVLERFDDYWGEKPNVKRIEYILYPETSSRMTALMTGEVDIITQLPPDQIATIEKEPGLNVVGQNITNLHVLIYNTKSAGMQDKKLRQALNLAIDRQALADTLWGGRAVVPHGHQYPEFGTLYDDTFPIEEYNPEKARQLVSESSYNGEVLEYELKSGYYTFGNEAAEAIVAMWKEIGVNAQIVFRDTKEYNNVSNWSNTMRFPDPSAGLWLLWGPGSTPAENTWLDMPQEFIDAGKEMSSIIDPVRRKALSKKLMTIWREEAPGALLYYPYESWGIRDGLEWTPYSSQAMDFRAGNFKLAK